MSDQGEKIVFLAREILNAGVATPVAAPVKKGHITMSLKTLCLTTVLAAGVGATVVHLVHANDKPLSHYEKTELDALIFYAAKTKSLSETELRHAAAAKAGVRDLGDLTAANFASTRQFLQEQAQ